MEIAVIIFLILAVLFIFFLVKLSDDEVKIQSSFKEKLSIIKKDLDKKEKDFSEQYGECTRKVIANFDTKEVYDFNSRLEFAKQYGNEKLKIIDDLSLSTVNSLDYLYVFQQTETLIINNNPYKFNDILDYDIEDTPTTKTGNVSTTKSNTGSMIGRAIVGDLVAGQAGAIIGGSTGKKTTITTGEDNLIHNYTINITINNLKKPIESINTKNDSKATSEIVSILNIILNNKKK